MIDRELLAERVAAARERRKARPAWQKVLITVAAVVLGFACSYNLSVDDNAARPAKPAAEVRDACGHVDGRALATLFETPLPAVTERPRVEVGGVVTYSCLVESDPGLRLRLDLSVQHGRARTDDPLFLMSLANQSMYSVDGTDGVLTAAKRQNGSLFGITLTGSSGAPPVPLTEERLRAVAAAVGDTL
ncbi:hypothetical protein AB0J72_34585 [Dactylosporangium sp. NPDC049742]|uniref:hypothetical protein n=1 Tax=Dactylosporangium sp. NPDC049742 TaxID=3154737 RepID=UPI003434E0E5